MLRNGWRRYLCLVVVCIAVCMNVAADHYTDYITDYCELAVEQQELHGIPASITLAQGLLESAAGRSTLAVKGNNHFGIKCHREWEGDTLLRNDDAANECFRAYPDVRDSYEDHSGFLLRKRYSPLFELDVHDYVGWAHGLRKCGYATDPNYAFRLIAIIERYRLYQYDIPGAHDCEETVRFIQESLASSHPVRKTRGLHYVIAAPGDRYSDIAKEFGIDKKKLMTYNDARKNGPIKDWEEVYLEPKHSTGPDDLKYAVIGEDESMHSLSQRFAMSLESLKKLNPDKKDSPGSRLRLR